MDGEPPISLLHLYLAGRKKPGKCPSMPKEIVYDLRLAICIGTQMLFEADLFLTCLSMLIPLRSACSFADRAPGGCGLRHRIDNEDKVQWTARPLRTETPMRKET